MANIPFLLQSNFNYKPSLQQSIYSPRPSSFQFPIKLRNHFPCSKITKTCPSKCLIMNPNRKPEMVLPDPNRISDVNQVIWISIRNVLLKPVIAGVLLGLLLSYDHHHGGVAMAASRGGMDGSSVSSSSSSSSDSRSDSTQTDDFAAPSSRSYYQTDEIALYAFKIIAVIAVIGVIAPFLAYHIPEKTSIIKLQVGLLGTATSLQKDLNQDAESADISTPQGFRFILQEATVGLLKHLDYCVSGYSSVDMKWDEERTMERFNQLSVEERVKFHDKTLVNVNNIGKQSATCQTSPNEYIVVTLIVATEDVQHLPDVKNSPQLKEALQKLASIPSYKITAATVSWTPQQDNHCLTEREFIKYYPLLRPL